MTFERKRYRVFLLVTSFFLLALLLHFSDIGRVFSVLQNANIYLISVALPLSFFLMIIRTLRWKILLERLDIKIPFKSIFPLYMSGLFASNLTPGKIGEPFKNYLLKKKIGHSISKTIPSVVMERSFDVFTMILIAFPGIFFIHNVAYIKNLFLIIVLIYLVPVSLIFYVGLKKERIRRLSNIFIRFFGWLPFAKKIRISLERVEREFSKSVKKYKEKTICVKTLTLSLIIWVIEGVILYLSALSVGIDIDILLGISFFSLSALLGMASFLPGGIGSTEVVLVFFLFSVYATPIHSITAAVFLSRFLGLWLNLLVGGICVNISNLK